VTATVFPLRFTLANRTLLSASLHVVHINGFGRFTTDDAWTALPAQWPKGLDGYLVHSAQVTGELPDLERTGNRLRYKLAQYTHYRTDLRGSFDDFLKTKASKTRSTLRRKLRKFTEADKNERLNWAEYRRPDELDEFFELAIPLAHSTYQAKLFDGALPDTTSFIEQSRSLAERGKLRCYLLFLNEAPVAYLYSPIEDRTAVYAYLGYDEAAAALSPGTVLQYIVHQQLFDDPEVDWFDFTEGEGPHKALFATERLSCCNILFIRDTAKIRWSVKSHVLWNHTIFMLKKVMSCKSMN
tara:strand:+ start:17749 stop:18642 length:894 start_codon:yes stop_codon:yes gene_type:complete